MTQGKEWKLILLFTLPIMAGNLLQQLYNTVDGIVAGRFIGETALGAIGNCQPLTFLFLAFAMGLSVGAGVVIAQYFGAKLEKELSVAVDTALILLGAVGIVLTVVGFAVTPLLLDNVLGVSAAMLPMAVAYFRIYCLGLFFQFIYNAIAAILRAVGDSKSSLYFLLISAVLNTVLDLVLVITFEWGVSGTAIATVISQIVCCVVSYIYLRKKFPYVRDGRHFDRAICGTMTRLGLPSAIQQSIVAVGNVAMMRLVNGFGDSTVAAYSAGVRITSFVSVPVMGFNAGLSSFTGQNIGAGRLDRVRRGLYGSVALCLAILLVLCVVLFAFAGPIVRLFGLTDEALHIGAEQIRFLMPFFLVFGFYMTLGGLLQGAGDTLLQSVATLTALTIRVVAGYVGVHFGWLGYSAAWVTMPYGWFAATAITVIRYVTGGWKRKAVVNVTLTDGPPPADLEARDEE